MPHDAKHAVGDAMTLDCVAGPSLGVHGAVGPAQPTAAKDLARMLDGTVLCGLRGALWKWKMNPSMGTAACR